MKLKKPINDGHIVNRNVSHDQRIPKTNARDDGNMPDNSEDYVKPHQNNNSNITVITLMETHQNQL